MSCSLFSHSNSLSNETRILKTFGFFTLHYSFFT